MHAYGAQHELAPYLLGTNGLFGHCVRQGPAFRFWTPCECMMIHGHDQPSQGISNRPIAAVPSSI